MHLLAKLLATVWERWTALPLAKCCPACCINWAAFR